MALPYLKYRTRFVSSLKNELIPLFDLLSKRTRIPKSRLLDEAIEDLLHKYENAPPKQTFGGDES
ncbi:MAG: ribbon-helix-helix domain-containing protein [Oscillospiraceae bacterium]|nr:ribbon-helix-helix domain-containing protein [Oscillospiraceae bacterium]